MNTGGRGQSEVLGVVLLLGITVAGITLVVAVGGTALEDSRSQLGTERAEKSLTQLDSKAAMVALGNSKRQEVEVARMQGADYHVDGDAGWMNVTITNTTSGNTTTVVNESLGEISYVTGRTTVAYQGGGIWRSDGDGGSTMVSPPEFHYRNATLTLPLISMNGTGEQTLDDSVVITRNGSQQRTYPNATLNENFTNPLENGKVNVTVHSDYYRAWGDFFEERTDGVVYEDPTTETVTVTLKTPAGKQRITGAVSSTASSGSNTLDLSGAGGDTARTDSYDSSVGPYDDPAQNHSRGNITVGGSVDIAGNSCVNGTVKVGDQAERKGGSGDCGGGEKVTGDVFYGTSNDIRASDIGGTDKKIDGIESVSNVNSLVADKVRAIEKDPDSDADISGASLGLAGDGTLESGQYYLEEFDLGSGETLTLDTTSGDIAIAVEDHVELTGSANVSVQGDGEVKVYVAGTDDVSCNSVDAEVCFERASGDAPDVHVPGDNATQFWIYGRSNMTVEAKGDGGDRVRYDGVIYAPGGTSGTGTVILDKAQVFGGVVSASVDVDNGGEVHFDEALVNEQAVPRYTKIIKITYLHISVNRIDVTSG
jgi:hypothetical protein